MAHTNPIPNPSGDIGSSSSRNAVATPIPSEVTFLISHITNLVRVTLDAENFFVWTEQLTYALRANDLMGYLDGSYPCPPDTINGPPVENGPVISLPNPAYYLWLKVNRLLISCILSTISPNVLTTVDDFQTAAELWEYLLDRFSSLTTAHLHELKTKLQNVRKTRSMGDYLKQIKELVNKLAAAGDRMKETDLIFHTLSGLPFEFNGFKSAIRARGYPIDFNELCSLLEAEEINITRDRNGHNISDSTALSAQYPRSPSSTYTYRNTSRGSYFRGRTNSSRGSGRGRSGRSGRGGRAPAFITLGCQICGMQNHTAAHCYQRFNEGFHPPQVNMTQLQSPPSSSPRSPSAASSLLSGPTEPHWFFDSGATHHVTNDAASLQTVSPYTGSETLTVGSGSQLPIQSTGSGGHHTGQQNTDSSLFGPM